MKKLLFGLVVVLGLLGNDNPGFANPTESATKTQDILATVTPPAQEKTGHSSAMTRDHRPEHQEHVEQLPMHRAWYALFALLMLMVIVTTSLKEGLSIWKKISIFGALGIATASFLATQGSSAVHVLHEVFAVDYVQFIAIPLVTVFIASLDLFALKVPKGTKLGWFMWIGAIVIGNHGTTWALVPVATSLLFTLREQFPNKWKVVLVTFCVFGMNLLALCSGPADPPNAYYAVKKAALGVSLGYYYPLPYFKVYLLFTGGILYPLMLKRLGVDFGSPKEMLKLRPKSWPRFSFGMFIAGMVGYAVSSLKGYEITIVLGTLSLLCATLPFVVRSVFGEHERHHTKHWGLETVFVFIAFFSVVAFAHTALHGMHLDTPITMGVTVLLTLAADNAAAFAAAFPQYMEMPEIFMMWHNLFPSVTFGSASPLGNGPQIILFLVILVGLRYMSAKEVFRTWLIEASVIVPNLLVWTISSYFFLTYGEQIGGFSIAAQVLTGIVGVMASMQAMDLQRTFRMHVRTGWDGRPTAKED